MVTYADRVDENATTRVCPRCEKATLKVGCVTTETDPGIVRRTLTKSCESCGYPEDRDANEVGFDVVKRATEGR